ncbi:putative quinol monooxygenase [Microbacterium sp. RD1]|uniref:putative quinol monooxygenase n=1 Tax=Microbacterium sp. RD1 TaxID=3457313 RepID=UPI003FA58BE1
MPTEFIRLVIHPGQRGAFFAAVGEVGPAYLAQPGVGDARFFTQDDDADTVLAVIEWESDAALDAAVASPSGQAFLGAIGPLLAEAPDLRRASQV